MCFSLMILWFAWNKKWRMIRALWGRKYTSRVRKWIRHRRSRMSTRREIKRKKRSMLFPVHWWSLSSMFVWWERKWVSDAAPWLDIPLACTHVTRLFLQTSSFPFIWCVISNTVDLRTKNYRWRLIMHVQYFYLWEQNILECVSLCEQYDQNLIPQVFIIVIIEIVTHHKIAIQS